MFDCAIYRFCGRPKPANVETQTILILSVQLKLRTSTARPHKIKYNSDLIWNEFSVSQTNGG